MSVNVIKSIFKKQCKDLWKNKAVLIQFTIFPFLCLFMTLLIRTEQFTHIFFVNLFSTMYIGMVPLNSMNSIISEEKEIGTMSMLKMLRVKPLDYFIGVGSSVFLMCFCVSFSFGIIANYSLKNFFMYLIVEIMGIIISMMIGSIIALLTANQSAATSIATPIRLMISFSPMMAMLNPSIKKYFSFLYTQQINNCLTNLSNGNCFKTCIIVNVITVVFLMTLFTLLYRRKAKREEN